jgi:hypothetical protein
MPVSTIIALVGAVAIFAAFASALAWVQLQTRRPAIASQATRHRKKRPF